MRQLVCISIENDMYGSSNLYQMCSGGENLFLACRLTKSFPILNTKTHEFHLSKFFLGIKGGKLH